ncbi:MAG TPA: hypothetical protein DD635_01300 [Flavobacteriales bacterium]|nr:hypothetical protein [Flavobacteriales bacterium]
MEFATPGEQGERLTIECDGWALEYAVWTTDNLPENAVPIIVAFHGFARPLEDLHTAHRAWPHQHAMISIHLPHHGGSRPIPGSGPDDRALEPMVLNRIIDTIVSREIPNAGKRILLGYSIGGRIALALMVDCPKRWPDVVLLAPDGLKQSPYYAFTVHTRLGRWVWFWLDRHEQQVKKWSDVLLHWRLISKHLHGFIYFHSSSHAMRMMVWKGWRSHRKCWPSQQTIKSALEQIQSATFIFGKYDKIIPPKNANRLRRITRNQSSVKFHTIRSGHNMLKPDTLQEVVQCIFGK